MTKTKWFGYTVLLGALPILMRLLVKVVASDRMVIEWISAADMLSFGLLLSVTNISGIESSSATRDGSMTVHIVASLTSVALICALFAATMISNDASNILDIGKTKFASGILALSCLVLSFAVWDRLISYAASS